MEVEDADKPFAETLRAMLAEIERAPAIIQPSAFWRDLNRQHLEALAASGIENFKRTLARHYFMWTRVLPWDSQILFLIRNLPINATLAAALGAFRPLRHEHIPLFESVALNFLTRLLWSYATREAPDILSKLSEPETGSPPRIEVDGQLVSQDLANSALEFQSFKESAQRASTICELGGGYGRTAFVTTSLCPRTKYVMVDIPPAIGVAQTYLCAVFPERRHFRFRPFTDFASVKAEFDAADIVYLLPHQLDLLPDGIVDLFINISSLHEMRHDQVEYYLNQIKRLVRTGGHFYLKAWRVSNNPHPDEQINEGDYDLRGWDIVFNRTPKVQSRFFEVLLSRTR